MVGLTLPRGQRSKQSHRFHSG
ncbi:hypothetical protein D030_2073A, partial [Vibrio parahaemolyticus AQ3810]